jgi:hypothetical protein
VENLNRHVRAMLGADLAASGKQVTPLAHVMKKILTCRPRSDYARRGSGAETSRLDKMTRRAYSVTLLSHREFVPGSPPNRSPTSRRLLIITSSAVRNAPRPQD